MGNFLKKRDEQGTVLVLVLLVLALISVLILAWAQEWRIELKLTGNFQAAHVSRRLAEAGVYYAIGKLMAAKIAPASFQSQETAASGKLWQGDQSQHILELPEGKVEVRVADEAGKINLNRAPEAVLRSLFTVLGVTEPRLSVMVDSILDWRGRGEQPRLYGAKSDYYLGLQPPYVARKGNFRVVEELAWVRGFEAYPLLHRLGNLLTVYGLTVNINTAPLEVLETMGFSPDEAETVIASRQFKLFKGYQEISKFSGNLLFCPSIPLGFQTAPFFSIISTGQAKNQAGTYIIKAIVRLDGKHNSWKIVSWFDGFPSS